MSISRRIGDKLGVWAEKLDDTIFHTKEKQQAESSMVNDPAYQAYLNKLVGAGQLKVEDFANPTSTEMIGFHKTYEQSTRVHGRALSLIEKQVKGSLGVDLPDEATDALVRHYEKAAITDPESIARQFAAFEQADQIEKQRNEQNDRAEKLVRELGGEERYNLLRIKNGLSFWNRITGKRGEAKDDLKEWLGGEAKKRGYGPIRTFLFTRWRGQKKLDAEIGKQGYKPIAEELKKAKQAEKLQGAVEGADASMESLRESAFEEVEATKFVFRYAREAAIKQTADILASGLDDPKVLAERRAQLERVADEQEFGGLAQDQRDEITELRRKVNGALVMATLKNLSEGVERVAAGHEQFSKLNAVAASSVEILEQSGRSRGEAVEYVKGRIQDQINIISMQLPLIDNAMPDAAERREANRSKRIMLSMLINTLR